MSGGELSVRAAAANRCEGVTVSGLHINARVPQQRRRVEVSLGDGGGGFILLCTYAGGPGLPRARSRKS